MTKRKSTKRALLLSALSLLMCVSMLIGTTFAWFTDSVTSGRNTIMAGNLDIVLEYWDGDSYEEVTTSTKLFNDAALWEPGYTEVAYLKVSNAGSLALKYHLAVNVYNEILGKTKTGEDIKLSDHLQFKVVESDTDLADTYATREAAQAADATATKLQTYSSDVKALENTGDTDYVALIIYMPTTVGNEANHDGVNIPKIEMGVNLFATQQTAESDSFNNQYDKNAIIVTNAAEAQAALDNAEPGATIKLAPGVNYGTLVFNQNADSKVVDITAAGGDAAGNEHYSKYENITIIGAPGAIVDRIDFNAGWIAGSGASFIDIKNLTIKDVTFSGASTAVKIPEGADAIAIDGLSLVNCKMIDTEGNDRFVYQPRSGYKAVNDKTTGEYVMTSGIKNLTITGCEITGAHQVIEARAMENLTITNNTFNGIKSRDILLGADPTALANGITYTGTITITGNTSIKGEERFVRGAGMGDANVIIKDNTILNYMGKDADYIKVTDGNNVTIANNTMTRAINADSTTTLAQFTDIFANGGSIFLKENVTIDTSSNKNITVSGDVNIYADDNVTLYFPKTTVFGGDGTITVHGGKITTPQELCISGDSKLVIDGGEHTFGAFSATGNGTIVVNDGVLNCKGSYAGVMGISFGETGSLYVNGGKLNMYEPFNLNANRCDAAYIEINGGTIELLNGMADMFVVRNVMDKDVTSGVSRGSSIKITGGTFIAHYEVDSDNDATSFIRNGDPNDTNKVLVSNIKDNYNCVVTGGTFYGSWQRADNTRYENSDGLMVYNSIEGFVANGYQITGNPDDGYVVSKS